MENKEIRRLNLRGVIDHYFDGVDRRLALALDKQPSEISRLFTKNEESKRNISDVFSRKIEKLVDKQLGWMDTPHLELWGVGQGDYIDAMDDLVDNMTPEQISRLMDKLTTKLVELSKK